MNGFSSDGLCRLLVQRDVAVGSARKCGDGFECGFGRGWAVAIEDGADLYARIVAQLGADKANHGIAVGEDAVGQKVDELVARSVGRFLCIAEGSKCSLQRGDGIGLAEGEDAGIQELVSQRLAAIPRVDNAPFLARLGSLREIAPSALRGLGHFLLEATFSSGLNSSSRFRKQHDTYVRQRQIAEAYEDLRQAEVVAPDIMSDTYQLASFLNRRDSEGAQEFISRYLAKLLLVSNWNLTKLRAHVRTLAAVVTSQDVLDGVVWEDAMRREWLFMTRIERAPDAESICTSVAEFVLRHFGRAGSTGAGDRTLSDRVTEWLEQHCQEGATLKDASRAVGVSISTISHQLPLDIGKTFTELRAEIRIALAKRLLATSEMPISAIADACGFSDQSHFTKALKTAISLTPGQFRRMLYSFETESKTLG